MVKYEITRIQKLLEINNDMAHNYYYLCYGRIYNETHAKYKKFKFVIWFDIFDVMEFYEKDSVTNNEIKEYAHELAYNNYLANIKNYNDEKRLKEFYEYCHETIENYNKIVRW